MLKNFLILFIFVMAITTGYVLYLKTESPPSGFINDNIALSEEIKEPKKDEIGLQIINEMNLKNRRIQNFSCDNLIVYTWYQGLRLKLKGSIYFDKPMNLKMDVDSSIVGKEFIMGSNDDEFWFWSRRLNPPSLYFAKHSDYQKTRLKTVFNPVMIMDSLGFEEIVINDSMSVKEISEDGVSKIAIIEKTTNSTGKPIGRLTFIDKSNKRLLGQLITDDKGEMIASAEILEYKNNLPSQIIYTWYEEDQAMLIELPNGKINTDVFSNWKRPKHNQEINMGEITVDLKWDFKE